VFGDWKNVKALKTRSSWDEKGRTEVKLMISAELEKYPEVASELKCEGKRATCTIQVITSFGIKNTCMCIREYRKE